MSGEALGGGVMVAVAAALWVTYLMPTWSRRKQYLATERNAVRLQQTLRILAETAEVPGQVRLEANARTVAAQQKLLARVEGEARAAAKAMARVEAKSRADAAAAARRAASRLAEIEAAAVLVAARAVQAAAAAGAGGAAGAAGGGDWQPAAVAVRARSLRRLRRTRALCSLILLAGLVGVVGGIVPAAFTGSWILLGVGALVTIAALGALARLAHAARATRVVLTRPMAASVPRQRFEPVQLEEAPAQPQTWTPQPLPRPLHLSRGSIAQTAMASVDAAAELRRAATEAELARRSAALVAVAHPAAAHAVTPITRPAAIRAEGRPAIAAAAAPGHSRFASMGIVGDAEPGISDLDAVLRRRRAVG